MRRDHSQISFILKIYQILNIKEWQPWYLIHWRHKKLHRQRYAVDFLPMFRFLFDFTWTNHFKPKRNYIQYCNRRNTSEIYLAEYYYYKILVNNCVFQHHFIIMKNRHLSRNSLSWKVHDIGTRFLGIWWQVPSSYIRRTFKRLTVIVDDVSSF